MNATAASFRRRQIVAWAIVTVFVLGFFFAPVGVWTGAVLGVWLAGTQRVGRGFVVMLGFAVLFALPHLVRGAVHGGVSSLPLFLGWTLAALVLNTLPFTFHRMVSPRLPGWLSTLPLPLFGVRTRDPCCCMGSVRIPNRSGCRAQPSIPASRLYVWDQSAAFHRLLVCGNHDLDVVSGISHGTRQAKAESSGSAMRAGRRFSGASTRIAWDVDHPRAARDRAGGAFCLGLPCVGGHNKRMGALCSDPRSQIGMRASHPAKSSKSRDWPAIAS